MAEATTEQRERVDKDAEQGRVSELRSSVGISGYDTLRYVVLLGDLPKLGTEAPRAEDLAEEEEDLVARNVKREDLVEQKLTEDGLQEEDRNAKGW